MGGVQKRFVHAWPSLKGVFKSLVQKKVEAALG